jgi:predicted alpha/beta hydrolase family esterase
MKKQVFYVHGGDSFAKREDWLQYLKTAKIWDLPGSVTVSSWKKNLPQDLGEEYEVFMPSMPNKQNAQYEEWKIWFERYFAYLRDGVILVGHSLGGMFLAKYLSENTPPISISVLYLLAAPGGEYLDEQGADCTSFKFPASLVTNIAKTAQNIEIWHSEDDFVVSVAEAYWYKKHLPEAKLRNFKDKNHFLLSEFPELIEELKAN